MNHIKSIGICVADEGFGHMVRQITIVKEFLRRFPHVKIHIYGCDRLSLMKNRLGPDLVYHYLPSLIKTYKTNKGALDLVKTIDNFREIANTGIYQWFENAKKLPIFNHDILISDSIPQLTLGKDISDALFVNISHFTWDWFWENIDFKASPELSIFKSLYFNFDYYIFGPLTPSTNFSFFPSNKIYKVGLILQHKPIKIPKNNNNEPSILNCLLMDNGTHTLSSLIEKALPQLSNSKKFIFHVGANTLSQSAIKKIVESPNMIPVSDLKEMHQRMLYSDLVVARGGCNTISELIAYKIPALLIKETDNPEILSNINMVSDQNYAVPIDPTLLSNGLLEKLDTFVSNDFYDVSSSLANCQISISGEKQISDILTKITSL